MQKTGQVDRTDDSEFKEEEARFRLQVLIQPIAHLSYVLTCSSYSYRLEKNANNLQKEAKNYLDSIRSVSASSSRIATTIDLFFGSDAGEGAMAANAYKRAVEDMEGSVARTIVSLKMDRMMN